MTGQLKDYLPMTRQTDIPDSRLNLLTPKLHILLNCTRIVFKKLQIVTISFVRTGQIKLWGHFSKNIKYFFILFPVSQVLFVIVYISVLLLTMHIYPVLYIM